MSKDVKIELTGVSYYGEDSSRISTSEKATNLFLDDAGFLKSRGGLSLITTTGDSLPSAPIDGTFYWVSKDLIMIVCSGSLYSLTQDNVLTLIGSGLQTNKPASFAVVRTSAGVESLAVANFGDIYIYDPSVGSWSNIYTIDNDCPRNVKKIVFLNGYLIAVSINSNTFHFSAVGNPVDWSALSFASAEANADIIETMEVKGFYLYLFGTNTVEIWYNDGTSPFIRLDGGLIENGTASPRSVAIVENMLFFLDNKRRICLVEGQSSYKVVSNAIDKFLQSLDSVEDAFAFPIIHQGRIFYKITFPTASRANWDGSSRPGITFIFDINNQQFFEWAQFYTSTAEFGKFPINCECFASLQQRQILGKNAEGKLFELDESVYQDDSDTLKTLWHSGFLDFGSLKKKRLRKMRFRGTNGTSSVSTVFQFRKRYDGNSEWANEVPLELQVGSSSLNQFHVQLNNLGMGRIAQFEVGSASNTPFCIGNVIIEVDLLRS